MNGAAERRQGASRAEGNRAEAGDRAGAVLVCVVLLVLALSLLTHALLVLAEQEVAASRAGAMALGTEAAAHAAFEAALRTDSAPPDSSRLWGSTERTVIPGSIRIGNAPPIRLEGSVVWSRLSRESWLVEGRAAGGVARSSVGRPVWVLDPVTRVSASEAIVTVGDSAPMLPDGVVDGTGLRLPPALSPSWACAPILAALDSTGWAGLPETARRPAEVATEIGRLSLDTLLARAETAVSEAGTPAPVQLGGACVGDPWNWGDPGGGGPCGTHAPLVRVADATSVTGGSGQGILVLEGSAELVGTSFYGVVVARGSLGLRSGARVTGLVRAGGGVWSDGVESVFGSACWAAGALSSRPLRRPLGVGESGWIQGR